MRRLILIAAAAAAALLLGLALHRSGSAPVVRGSSTEEFSTVRRPPSDTQATALAAWPTYGYDLARTHVAPVSFRLRPPYRKVWARGLDVWTEFPPSVAYGNVYAAQLNGVVLAYSARTGVPVWSRSFASHCTDSSPTIASGVLYQSFVPAPCDHGDRKKPGLTVAIDARTGRVLWRYAGPASESAPLVRDGILYEGSWDHSLYALDVRDHRRRLLWRFHADGELNSSAAYADGVIYVGSDDGHVYAVDARSGRQRWRASGFSHEYFYATPALAYGRVFIGNTDGTMYAFGAATGHLLWSAHAGTYVYSAAAVADRTVYVGSYDGNVYAFDAASGATRWKTNLGGAIHGAPTVMGGLVYFSTCSICADHPSRYVARGPHHTFALDTRSGRIVWRFPDGQYSPIVSDGKRVYLMGDSVLYGLVPCGSRSSRCR